MTEELKQKAEEWRKNYIPMGITCIERDGVVIETQCKATKIIEEPNPFRIKDGWYELYLRDLDNAYIAGATENGIQWHDSQELPPKDKGVPSTSVYVLNQDGEKCFYSYKFKQWKHESGSPNIWVIHWCEIPQFKE